MSEQLWEQMDGESPLWYRRFTTFRLMMPVRSIAAVFQQEEESRGKQRTDPPGPWYEIARQWKWEERAAAWDKHESDTLAKVIAAERAKVLTSGYALMHKRVEQLNALVEQLIEMATHKENVWVPDVKSIGTGSTAERVDLVQFNDALFREIRAHFADIAAELGERVKKKEVAFKELPPDRYEGIDDRDEGSEE